MTVIKEIEKFHDEMTIWRREIHRYPELAFEETRTSDFVAKKLKEFGIEIDRGLATTGIVGTIRNGEGPSIGLRADFDALPMSEKNVFDHKSTNNGMMHACGHDGHVTMLLGAAYNLSKDKNFSGTVYFIFQPAEEGGRAGAKSMIDDGLFDKFKMDSVWGVHNWPGVELGKAVIHEEFAMAGGDLFEINILGYLVASRACRTH